MIRSIFNTCCNRFPSVFLCILQFTEGHQKDVGVLSRTLLVLNILVAFRIKHHHCLWVSCLFLVKLSFYLYTLECIDITKKEAKTVCVALLMHDFKLGFIFHL